MCLSIEVKHPEMVLSKGIHAGYEWITVHNGGGYRCGYVRVDAGHPWHGKGWDIVNVDMHGGCTFAEADMECDKGGEDNAWWIGFDCAHSGDAPDPALYDKIAVEAYVFLGIEGAVRTQEYVEAECRNICDQAAVA